MSRTTYLSAQEVADELAVDVQTVRRWIHAGDLRAVKPGKEFRIKEGDLEGFLGASEARPKAAALHSPEPSMRDELPEEWRLRQLRVIESSAGAVNDLFASEVERGEFGAEEYDRVGRAFEELDAALAGAMSNEYLRDEEAASEEEREAVNRAWGATMALQDTLGRAYLALLDRPGADVADLAEYRDSHARGA